MKIISARKTADTSIPSLECPYCGASGLAYREQIASGGDCPECGADGATIPGYSASRRKTAESLLECPECGATWPNDASALKELAADGEPCPECGESNLRALEASRRKTAISSQAISLDLLEDIAEAAGGRAEQDYSGRGMFGDSCAAIIMSETNNLYAEEDVVEAINQVVPERSLRSDLITSLSTDAMGFQGVVVYFPGVTCSVSDSYFASDQNTKLARTLPSAHKRVKNAYDDSHLFL